MNLNAKFTFRNQSIDGIVLKEKNSSNLTKGKMDTIVEKTKKKTPSKIGVKSIPLKNQQNKAKSNLK